MTDAALIDTHCHLGWDSLEADLERVLENASQAHVQAMVDVGIDVGSSQRALARSRVHEGLYPTAGLHPCNCGGQESDFAEIDRLCHLDEVVAVGETGLDLYWKDIPLATQRISLDKHLDLSRRTGKPLILHCRDAFDELLDQLRSWAPVHGILHCFSGDQAQADRCLELGLHLSFAGPLTYKKNEELRDVAARAPGDRILVETDAPFLPPQTRRGQRNEPAYVRFVFETLCLVRQTGEVQLAQELLANSRHLFGIVGTG